MKDSSKNKFMPEKKLMVCASQKSGSTTWNKAFVEKHVSAMPKNCLFWQKD